MKQQRSKCEKIEHGKLNEEKRLETLLKNPDYRIKNIKQLESHSQPTPKALGKYIAEATEKLRDLKMTKDFADRAVQGGKR